MSQSRTSAHPPMPARYGTSWGEIEPSLLEDVRGPVPANPDSVCWLVHPLPAFKHRSSAQIAEIAQIPKDPIKWASERGRDLPAQIAQIAEITRCRRQHCRQVVVAKADMKEES